LKIPNTEKGWQSGVSGRAPSKYEALNSNFSPTLKKKKDYLICVYHILFMHILGLFSLLASVNNTAMNMHIQKSLEAGHWWLTPVILATWEAEIRRITVHSQLRQIVLETLS
jgi:hypothetical protein